jgi:hypothetical protein
LNWVVKWVRVGKASPNRISLSHGVAERNRLNLGNLNPIYERELTKLDVHQEEGRWNVSKHEAGRKGPRPA